MAWRAVAVDLDGTLLNSKRTVSARNEKAIVAAAERGWTVILSTARPVRAVNWAVPESFGRFYWAVCNGAWLLKDGQILQRREISPEKVRHLIDLFIRHAWSFQVEAEDRMFTDCGVPDGFAGEHYPLSQLDRHGACKLIVNVSSTEDAAEVLAVLPEGCIGVVHSGHNIVFRFLVRLFLIAFRHVTDCPRHLAGMRAPPDRAGGRSMAVFRDDEDRQL